MKQSASSNLTGHRAKSPELQRAWSHRTAGATWDLVLHDVHPAYMTSRSAFTRAERHLLIDLQLWLRGEDGGSAWRLTKWCLSSETQTLHLPLFLSHAPVDGDGWEVLLHQELRQSHAAGHRLDKDHHLTRNKQELWLNITDICHLLNPSLEMTASPGWTRVRRAGRRASGSSRCPSACSNTAAGRGGSAWSRHPQTLPWAEHKKKFQVSASIW